MLRRRKWIWASWASAVLERLVRVVSSFGVGGGAGRTWIVSGRARKRACRRDQSVSCHWLREGVCECVEKGVSTDDGTYHDSFVAGTVLLFLTGGKADRDSIGPISLHQRGEDE